MSAMKPGDFARERSQNPTCRVIVALAKGAPSPTTLARLSATGLVVEEVIEDAGTIIGSIPTDAIPALESDEDVTGVERSQELGLHE